MLRAEDLKIVYRQPKRRSTSTSPDRVHQGSSHLQREGISELVRLALIGAFATASSNCRRVVAECVSPQMEKDVPERLLSNATHPSGGQLQRSLLGFGVARFLQGSRQVLQALHSCLRLIADELAYILCTQ